MVSSTSKWIFMTLNKHSHRVTNTYFITTRVGKKKLIQTQIENSLKKTVISETQAC